VWGGVWDAWGGVLVAWLPAVPLSAAGVWGLTRLRVRQGMCRRTALRFSAAEVGVLCGTVPWVWMILTPRAGADGVSAVPFRDLLDTLRGSPSAAIVQVGANLVLFVPLGFFLPLRGAAFAGVVRMTLLGAVLSASLEAVQYVCALGRVASVDDVLLNAAGAGVGAFLARLWLARDEERHARTARAC